VGNDWPKHRQNGKKRELTISDETHATDDEPWEESPEEREAAVAAVLKALEAMRAGDKGVPAEEFHARFRAEHGIPNRSEH
jgi:hypothetical protein